MHVALFIFLVSEKFQKRASTEQHKTSILYHSSQTVSHIYSNCGWVNGEHYSLDFGQLSDAHTEDTWSKATCDERKGSEGSVKQLIQVYY